MDINKVQKLNEMATNLKRHNIVYSKEDALSHAEGIYGKENDFSRENNNSEMRTNGIDELRKEIRKLSYAIQTLTNEMREMKAKSEQLEKELNDARVGQLSRMGAGQQKLSGEEQEKKRDLSKPIDRNNIAPSEVSVEKFFYYGK